MTGIRRNLWLAMGLIVLLAIGAAMLPSMGWTCALAAVLGLTGVVVLHGNRWRSGALLIAAVAVAVGLLDLFAGIVSPQAHGVGLVTTFEPHDWNATDAELGYRPRPGTKIRATSMYGDETVFRVTYTITPEGMRATPEAPAGADTYLFLGDSFMFGQGLADDQTLPAQFARDSGFKVGTVDFAAPGYAPNQLVRAFEIGLFDRLKGQPVKAVVTWIIPAHLGRVTGDGPWLGSSPRYVLENGQPRYTGTFSQQRWQNPLEGLRHLADDQFAFVAAIGMRQRQEHQAEIFTALMVRLQALAHDKFGAPLVVIYSWPDETSGPHHDNSEVAQPLLVSILAGLRKRGMPLLSVDQAVKGYKTSDLLLPHDGHPTALTDQLVAAELKRRLLPQ